MADHKSIKNWAEDERPREKVVRKGLDSLSDTELLAILINNGTRNKSALDLAKEVYALANNNLANLGRLTVQEISNAIVGIGPAKAISICSALEIGRRRQASETLDKKSILSKEDAVNLFMPMLQDKSEEHFAVAYLNAASKLLHHEILAIGGLTSCIADIRRILKRALETNAISIIIAHNHPSGNSVASNADNELTKRINEACLTMNIRLLDHLIIAGHKYYSYADDNKI